MTGDHARVIGLAREAWLGAHAHAAALGRQGTALGLLHPGALILATR